MKINDSNLFDFQINDTLEAKGRISCRKRWPFAT